jgi:prolyl-tRNA synthetase
VKAETGATIRCIPFDHQPGPGSCLVDGKPAEKRALFARAY